MAKTKFWSTNSLNPMEATYVAEVVAGTPRQEAALKAGYAPKNIAQRVSQLQRNEKVQDAIRECIESAMLIAKVNGAEVIQSLANIGFADIRKIVDPVTGEFIAIKDLPESMAKTISKVKKSIGRQGEIVYEYQIESRTAALSVLADIAKMGDRTNDGGMKTISDLVQLAVDVTQVKNNFKNQEEKVIEENPSES